MSKPLSHTFRSGNAAEVWNTRQGVVVKATVRVAKGDKSGRGGQFQGATNLRGSVQSTVGGSVLRAV